MKKLYFAKIEFEFPVVAESEEEAAEIASREAPKAIASDPPTDFDYDVELSGDNYIPRGYKRESKTLDGSMTLREAWKL